MRLADRVILVTGGSTGIGWECAKAYAREGARVAVVSRESGAAERAAGDLAGDHFGCRCDVSQGGQVAAAIERVLERFGRLDAIHNNAGIAHPVKPLHETSESEWDALMETNLKSVYHTTRHGFAALCAVRGCILNTTSLVGAIGQENHAAYTATKGGMDALTRSMALDYAPHGVRVNAVAPAGVWTPMLHKWADAQPDPAGVARYLDEIHALGYCPEAGVIADACVFLLSDEASFITGHILNVTGAAELGYRIHTRPKPR